MVAPTGRIFHLNEPLSFLSEYRPVACSSRGKFREVWSDDEAATLGFPICQRCVNRWSWWLRTIPAEYERRLVEIVEAHHAAIELTPSLERP